MFSLQCVAVCRALLPSPQALALLFRAARMTPTYSTATTPGKIFRVPLYGDNHDASTRQIAVHGIKTVAVRPLRRPRHLRVGRLMAATQVHAPHLDAHTILSLLCAFLRARCCHVRHTPLRCPALALTLNSKQCLWWRLTAGLCVADCPTSCVTLDSSRLHTR